MVEPSLSLSKGPDIQSLSPLNSPHSMKPTNPSLPLTNNARVERRKVDQALS